MNTQAQTQSDASVEKFRWSLRILILALAGIFLTLYPFRLALHAHLGGASPFLLQGWQKSAGLRDAFLNVLLSVPYGFGFAGFLRKRGVSQIATVSLSYSIELTQFFISDRDSGWEDVFTNSTGGLVGCSLFLLCGLPLLRLLQKCESVFEKFATVSNLTMILVCYFLAWINLEGRIINANVSAQSTLQ
jgi:hypothetical protein